jgi:bifunctional non-homologous end joining protein LigD
MARTGQRRTRRSEPAQRLGAYRAKRDFGTTPEPSGGSGDAPDGGEPAGRFVVQRHRARRLHYDLRLELDGVLVSWAVPKGPTLAPGARRLAVKVEDHPIEYLDFEGVIPAGEYGGGDVIVWDRGTWEPVGDDPAGELASGELHFDLRGEKLAGRFVLVRSGRADGDRDWLLLHKKDAAAVAGWDPEDHPRSVKSGRTNDEVATAPASTWDSAAPSEDAERRISWPPVDDEALAALDGLGAGGHWEIGGQRVRVTSLDRVLFPASDDRAAVTKRELLRYVARVSHVLLPHLAGRPVNTRRHPQGANAKGFWQKAVPAGAPDWVRRWPNPGADPGETQEYVVVDSLATLVFLANGGALELHPWTSRAARPDRPTYALIDIDPGPACSFDDVLVLARLYRTALDHLGVVGRPKVTGKRGIQIWVPVTPGPTFDETRSWVETISRAVGAIVPELVSWEWRVEDRGGLIRLDYTQNAVNKTLVAPYSTRAGPGAPVSVPLEWDELDDPDLRPDGWSIEEAAARVRDRGDPFTVLLTTEQRLPAL